jgi:hypothetical protein
MTVNGAMEMLRTCDATSLSWRRIAFKLKGEVLQFEPRQGADRFAALVVGTTDDAFVIYDPERDGDTTLIEPFDHVRSVTPLPEVRANELRAAFERSHAAA